MIGFSSALLVWTLRQRQEKELCKRLGKEKDCARINFTNIAHVYCRSALVVADCLGSTPVDNLVKCYHNFDSPQIGWFNAFVARRPLQKVLSSNID